MHATPETIRLVGGALCLDFVNTTEWEGGAPGAAAFDVLEDADMLVRWGRRVGVLSPNRRVTATDAEPTAARQLRAAIHEVFATIASGNAPRAEALEQLRGAYAEAVRFARIRPDESGWPLTWDRDDARSVRFAAAANAVALLGEPARLRRVRQCPGRNCGGLFVDSTGRRRWCSMEVCGSREKMRRLYQRQRASAADDQR